MFADECTIRVLVCGTSDRADDGVAPRAVAQLLPSLREEGRYDVDVRYCGQLDVEHLLDVPAGTPVLIVDAASGVPAGEIVTRDLDALLDERPGPAPRSSHALPIGQVLGVARAFAEAPLQGAFVGIGGADFGLGDELSPQVERALPAFVTVIRDTIEQLVRGSSERLGA
jgi:hydrogenase maturation protease